MNLKQQIPAKRIQELLQSKPHDLHKRDPYMIMDCCKDWQFSIARFYGGVKYGGHQYTYLPDDNACVRDDVLRWALKADRAQRRQAGESFRAQDETAQQELAL